MPNRLIKESIRTSKKMNALTDFEFRVWAYLITYVDDYGRGSADPELINNLVFPRMSRLTDDTVMDTILSLQEKGCICIYEVDGEPYLYFPNWSKHQTIRNKKSKFPDPSVADATSASNCIQLQANVPVIQSNPIQSNTNTNTNPNADANEFVVVVNSGTEGYVTYSGRAVDDYMNRINPEASPTAMKALLAFEKELSTDVCIRAFDIALDEKKTSWSYIKGILQNWKSRGIRCIADLEEAQEKREGAKPSSRGQKKYREVTDKNGFIKLVEEKEDEP